VLRTEEYLHHLIQKKLVKILQKIQGSKNKVAHENKYCQPDKKKKTRNNKMVNILITNVFKRLRSFSKA
jgi:hypothetical protein